MPKTLIRISFRLFQPQLCALPTGPGLDDARDEIIDSSHGARPTVMAQHPRAPRPGQPLALRPRAEQTLDALDKLDAVARRQQVLSGHYVDSAGCALAANDG